MQLSTIIVLLAAGLIFMLLEVFLPGGILGLIGFLLLIGGIISGFFYSATVGFILLLSSLVIGLISLYLWVKYFPNSRFGNFLFPSDNAEDWHSYKEEDSLYLNQIGTLESDCHPCGTARINGNRVDVISRGEVIEKGAIIKVIETKGNRIIVTKHQENQ